MLKKLAILGVLLLVVSFANLLFAVSVAQAETIVYGGGQFLLKGANTDEFGGGSVIGFGQQVSEKLIIWGQYTGFKTGEGVGVDNGLIGFSVLTDRLIPSLQSGLFLTVEGGLGKVEDAKVQFASLTNAGFFFDLSETTRLWLGGGYSNTGEVSVYSLELGLSMKLDF